MCGGQPVRIEHFAVGGAAAVKIAAVPGGDAGLVVFRLLARIVPEALLFIRLADLVDAVAVGKTDARDLGSGFWGRRTRRGKRHRRAQDGNSARSTPHAAQSALIS